jgi:ferrous iron transport protein B
MSTDKPLVLLLGPPNIGKSVLFNSLTGLSVQVANYQGTTVDSTFGELSLRNASCGLVDVPGTYSLKASCQAEEIAVDMLQGKYSFQGNRFSHCDSCPKRSGTLGQVFKNTAPDLAICVLDAVSLESSLYLALQVSQQQVPVIWVLNRMDLAKEKQLDIHIEKLSQITGIDIIPTIATKQEGINQLKESILSKLEELKSEDFARNNHRDNLISESKDLWQTVQMLLDQCVVQPNGMTPRQKIGHLLSSPLPGLPLAFFIVSIAFGIVVGLGMGLRRFLLLPILRGWFIPILIQLVEGLLNPGLLRNILIGEYGFLIKGIEWPFALVLPYVISFYLVMGLLEDSGYMPRLAGLLDGLLVRIGLPGSAIIPILLGYGCGIPAILSTRGLRSGKERLLVSSLICLTVPCISQTGAFLALLGHRSISLFILMALISLMSLILAGVGLNRTLKGPRIPTIIDIPEFLGPQMHVIGKKVLFRIKFYLVDGAIPMFFGIGIAAIMYETGLMEALGRIMEPLVSNWLHLPKEASVPLILGILRRELTVLPLLEMDLTNLQVLTGSVVALFYVPCIAMVATLAKEFNVRVAVNILLGTTVFAFIAGGLVAQIGALLHL